MTRDALGRRQPVERRVLVVLRQGEDTAVDVCAQATRRLGGASPGDALEGLLEIARTGRDPLVVRIEGACALDPLETERLRNLAAAADGALRLELGGPSAHRASPASRRPSRPTPRPRGRGRALVATGVVGAVALVALALGALSRGPHRPPAAGPPESRERPRARAAGASPRAPAPPAGPAARAVRSPVEIGINATPWADVEMDGRALGATPLGGLHVSPGPHVFRARTPDGRWHERRVEIGPERRTVVFR